MLDQADFIARYDQEDVLKIVASQPTQLLQSFAMPSSLPDGVIKNIVLAGMGGSALAGEFLRNWLGDRLPVPLEVVRDYTLPAYVNEDTLVVCSSTSGNTEETLAALDVARERGAKIVVMASGGKLLGLAREQNLPFFELPAGIQPRLAVLAGVRAWAQLLEGMKVLGGLVAELEPAAEWVAKELGDWRADRPAQQNIAKQIANDLVGHPVVVYAGPQLRLCAMKWKIDFNENSKNIAFYNVFPELNHNEFIGWGHPGKHGLKVVELRSNLDHPQVVKRFETTNKLLSNRFAPVEVYAKGDTRLEQLLWTLLLGDFTSAYLAFLNGVNPTPVELVEKLKKELA